MKRSIFMALAAALWMAGCDDDSAGSNACSHDDIKSDCKDGQFSRCVGGSWEKFACENEASCRSDGNCGVCKNGDFKADCKNGQYSKCADGQWTQVACEGGASCNADGRCGECKDGDSKADCKDGQYSQCVDGKWTGTACENDAACNADGECGECKDGDVKADCKEGQYSKCVDGAWTGTACEGGVSCKADGTCGECVNDAVKDCTNDDQGVGQVTVCKDGQWSETKIECPGESGKVSCKADGTCGECLTGDSTQCQNDEKGHGSAIFCKDGQWATSEKDYCPSFSSCSMTDDCYQCYYECDRLFTCDENCADSSCEEACNKLSNCKARCGECDSKCGECINGDHRNCVEDAQGAGIADICANGKWNQQRDCATVLGRTVACMQRCNQPDGCNADEYVSVCGECQNSEDPICVGQDNPYGVPPEHQWELVYCRGGMMDWDHMIPCTEGCKDQNERKACLQNVETSPK